MINNELKGLNRVLLLVHAYIRFYLWLNQNSQNSQKHGPILKGQCQKVVPLYIG